MTFSGPITAFKVVLPSGYTNLAAHSNALVHGAQVGSCTSQTTNAPGDTVQCTMDQPQSAGTQIDAVFQTGDKNGFARMPSGSGADLYSLAPSQGGPWRLSGP